MREELVHPILTALGYKLRGKALIRRSVNVQHPFVRVGTSERQLTSIPDYLLTVNGKNVFVLDAKAPNEEIKTGPNREQAYFYAIHPEIRAPLYGLCNGNEFIVFRVDSNAPVLYFLLSEIAEHEKELRALLSPSAFGVEQPSRVVSKSETGYSTRKPLVEILNVKKQAAARHFGVHAYFTKQAWEVVQAHIINFTNPGDMVLDPFGGSGVTMIEAIMQHRQAIQVDINPLANFIVRTLIEPVQGSRIISAFEKVQQEYERYKPHTSKDRKRILASHFYPKKVRLMGNADVKYLHELFSEEQLANLALLRALIAKLKEPVRSQLLLAFSSTLNKYNLTFHYTKSEGGGDSSAFRYYRFRIAPDPGKMELMKIFEGKLRRLLTAKADIFSVLSEEEARTAIVKNGSATDLSFVPDESVDYIYTDHPYGSKIPYLDLSLFWNAWLGFKVTEQTYKMEAIEGGEHELTRESYSDLLYQSLEQMFRKLKYDRWMSFVFAHKDQAYFYIIVQAAERVGFEYVAAVPQKSGQSSFKKRQKPFTVLHGQLILHFRKVKNPRTIMKVALGEKIAEIIQQTIEGIIARDHGATLEQINDELTIKGLEFSFLDLLKKEVPDLTAHLLSNFQFDNTTNKFYLKPNTKFAFNIDLNLKVGYYLLSFLRRKRLEGEDPSFDDVVLHIMPLLKNGKTPEKQTILNVLEKLAHRVGHDNWQLDDSQGVDLFTGQK